MQQKRGHVKQPRFMKRESAFSFTSKDDSSTTAGKAMFQMLGVFAEFERGIIRERVNAVSRARGRMALSSAAGELIPQWRREFGN